jgi:hypothetical protein
MKLSETRHRLIPFDEVTPRKIERPRSILEQRGGRCTTIQQEQLVSYLIWPALKVAKCAMRAADR